MLFANDNRDQLNNELAKKQKTVNTLLKKILAENLPGIRVTGHNIEPRLRQAIQYTLEAPGKRIRAAILMWSCELIGGRLTSNAKIAAAAIEMVHTYSLIHDDLPAMDNDDLRRGRPTCHRMFDEATAILTGDALLTLAFKTIAVKIKPPKVAASLIRELADAAGASGMIAGQMADIKSQDTKGSIQLLEYIHTNKTAKMFRAAAAMGAICGYANSQQFKRLCKYGLKTGLAFQIADDILDVTAPSSQLGKTAGKDAKAKKLTYPTLLGIEISKTIAERFSQQAVSALKDFGPKADKLRHLTLALLHRKN